MICEKLLKIKEGNVRMSEITWIKLKTDMFENQKIKLIEALPEGDTILVIWIKLLTYAGRTNANGFILINEDIALSVEEMSIIFSRPLNVIRLALEAFKRYGMITLQHDVIRIKNWEVYQNTQGMERAKQLNSERQRKFRERQKLELPPVSEDSNVSVTLHNATDIDKELDIDKEKEKDINNISDLPVIESQFNEWWNVYNKKKDKPKAFIAFKKVMKKPIYDILLSKTKEYVSGFTDPNDTFKKHPTTFLNAFDVDNDYTPQMKGGQKYGTAGTNHQSSRKDNNDDWNNLSI